MPQKRKQEATWKNPQSPTVDLGLLREEVESLRLRLFKAESTQSKAAPDQMAKTRLVEEILRSRRRRDYIFGANLFGEPAWDILLSLFLAEQQQIRTTISDACRASASPQTTGLRWIRVLEEQGWIARECDRLDGRRVYLTLTDQADAVMQSYLEQLAVKAA